MSEWYNNNYNNNNYSDNNKKEKNHFVHNTICAANFNMSYKAAASKILEELN